MTFPVSIIIALSLNALDMVSGLIVAIKHKDIKSTKLRNGLFKKIGFIICYLLGWGMDNYGDYIGFSINIPVLPLIIFYACTTEIVSIIENISKLNPDILPQKLLQFFNLENDDKRNDI